MSVTGIQIVVTPDNKVFEKADNQIRVASVGIQGVPGPHIIGGAVDTDLETKREGSVMAFSEDSQKWQSTNELRNIKINCGSF